MTDNRNLDQDSGTQSGGGRSTPRQRAIEAYGSARHRIGGAGRKAGETLDEAPPVRPMRRQRTRAAAGSMSWA